MNDHPLVLVTWNDAWGNSHEDIAPSDALFEHRPMEMQTVGWLVHQDEAGVSLFTERKKTADSYRGRTFIPRAMVVSIDLVIKPRRRKTPTTTEES